MFLLYLSTSDSKLLAKLGNQKFYDIDVHQMIQGRLVDVVETDLIQQGYVDGDDDPEYDLRNKDGEALEGEKKIIVERKIHVEANGDIVGHEKTSAFVARPNAAHSIPKPTLSPEILELYRRLNFSETDYPGRYGAPVWLPEKLDPDIERMVNQSKAKYQINEFVSNLVPLDREIPDIRTDYCKAMKYSDKLPMASVIMVFHNEPLSMILR